MDENLMVSTDIEFLSPEKVENNPMLTKVKIKIAAPGRKNKNRFEIPQDVLFEAAEKTLGLTPIVALYNPFKGDFEGHGEQALLTQDGEYVTTSDTRAIGVIPEKPEIFIEGDYISTYGYLWTERYEESVKALDGRPQSMELSQKHTILEDLGNGYTKIVSTAFEGLCILGSEIPPAFPEASVEKVFFSVKNEETLKRSTDEIIEALHFALSGNEPTLVVDVDGEERDKANRENVTEAIEKLDIISATLDEEGNTQGRDDIEDVISTLVDTEISMKTDADVIPVSEAAQRGLVGVPGSRDGIVSTDNLNYAKSSNSLSKEKEKVEDETKEEIDLATKNKKDEKLEKELNKEEEMVEKDIKEAKEEDKDISTKEKVEPKEEKHLDEEIGEEKRLEEESEEIGPESAELSIGEKEAEVEEAISTEEAIESGEEADIASEQVYDDGQGAASVEIATKRKTAEDQRTGNLLSDVGDDELLSYLTDRIEKQEEIKTRLQDVLQKYIPEELPEHREEEVVVAEPETTLEEVGSNEIEDISDATLEDEVVVEEEADSNLSKEAEEVSTDTEEAEEVEEVQELEEDAEVAKDEEEEVEKEVDQEKKKKTNFSIDFKEVLAENLRLEEENIALLKENKELLSFKNNYERKEKEQILLDFSLSKESEKEILDNLDSLSFEDVEAKAALAQHREQKAKIGQKRVLDGIQFSSEVEDSGFDPLAEALKQARDKVNSQKGTF